MDESSNLQSKAKEIIENRSYKDLLIVVNQLYMRQDSEEHKTARALYEVWVSCFPDALALKLLRVYRSSSNGITRFRSIFQLSEALTALRNCSFRLSLDFLQKIKRILIECLTMQETIESDIKILRKIVSCVAYNVLDLHKDKWDELGDCILTLASSEEPVMAFHVFIDLPPVYMSFIDKFLPKILEEASTIVLDPYRVGDWSLALQTFVKMWIQLLQTGMRVDSLKALMEIRITSVVNSVKKLVEKDNEQFLVQGLEDFEKFFSRDMNLYHYTTDQCDFVSDLMIKIEGVGTHLTKEIVRKITKLVTEQDNSAITPQNDLKNRIEEFDRGWNDHLKNLSSLEVLKIFASADLEDRSREIAIRRLNVLLSDHTSDEVPIEIPEMRELQPLLISCLKEEAVSDSMFEVLGEVVNHVTYELMVHQDEKCYELRDYISSSTTGLFKSIYIFQCLTMVLDENFLNPVRDKILFEILTRLDLPGESLEDHSCWVLVFRGAFCLAMHLIEEYPLTVKDIADKVIASVKKLVELELEVGLVRRAFRDVETIVKKQVEWYCTSEYCFLKGLLWRLYTIEGMKWESKIVLWRINIIVERGVEEKRKELPKNEFDWLNLTNEDVDDETAL